MRITSQLILGGDTNGHTASAPVNTIETLASNGAIGKVEVVYTGTGGVLVLF